ncbi:uncharacterized protein [Rutidosis leptorrhynchoides]|uniref:uncharacterized protein n=1 Tax=Rutidosis leptorrhynchoides TaxID=125765 RepID=UPI003A99CF83
MEKSQYSFWSSLFKNHCRAYEVLDHIIPATSDASSSVTQTSPPHAQTPSWERLDAIVLQWIYGTISLDLLHTVFKEESTAQQAWDRLKGNFGPAIEEDHLVLQLVTGLNESYASLRSIISHSEKLPSFNEARSMLIHEETHTQKLAAQAASTDATTLVSTTGITNQSPHNNSSNRSSNNRGRGVYRGNRGRNSFGNRGRGRSYSGASSSGFNLGHNTIASNQQLGLLGTRPNANYASSVLSQPTDIDAAMHTMSLNPPDDNWYLDTGATSHMTNNHGDGNGLPIQGYGHTLLPSPPTRPLHLNNVLYSSHLIINLISVRYLSKDNNISIEFDPFDFIVKDFLKGTPITRCNSTGDLYPFQPSLMQAFSTHSAFSVSSSNLWHKHLGHPGANIFRSLSNINYIPCNPSNKNNICQVCVFGKHVRLPLYNSSNITHSPFDILHSNLWISPIVSHNGHRYYMLLLDDKTNFLWTFPLSNKSKVFFYLY